MMHQSELVLPSMACTSDQSCCLAETPQVLLHLLPPSPLLVFYTDMFALQALWVW